MDSAIQCVINRDLVSESVRLYLQFIRTFFVTGVLRFLTARKCRHILWLTVPKICTLSARNEKHDDSPLIWLYEYP